MVRTMVSEGSEINIAARPRTEKKGETLDRQHSCHAFIFSNEAKIDSNVDFWLSKMSKCLKMIEKVSFYNIAFGQTELPDRTKLVENAEIQTFK